MDDLIQRARERYEELTKVIEAARSVNQEWIELRSFLEQTDTIRKRLDPQTASAANSESPMPAVQEPVAVAPRPMLKKGSVNNTADLADYVLRVYGPRLHLSDLLGHMITEGWEGSGDRRKDLKNLAVNLTIKKTRFRNVGQNTWEPVKGPDVTN